MVELVGFGVGSVVLSCFLLVVEQIFPDLDLGSSNQGVANHSKPFATRACLKSTVGDVLKLMD